MVWLKRVLWFFGIVCGLAAMVAYKRIDTIFECEPPEVSLQQWWGDEEPPKDWAAYLENSSLVIGNKLKFSDATIDDLRKQLNRTLRLPEPLGKPDFRNGFNTQELKNIVDYWRDDYLPRWREREVFLWQFNHFTTEIQGLLIHFLHLMVYDENKVDKNHYPVLLLHGWPSSIREFYPLIHKLHQTHLDKKNKYIFNVVVPSLPGFAWSQGASKVGLGPVQVAVIMRNLMLRLGYKRFFIHGSDMGSLVASHMATLFPENVLGYHSNLCAVFTERSLVKGFINAVKSNIFGAHGFEANFLPHWEPIKHLIEESGYYHLQATKPDTIGAVLTDNPIGLAAYILEKWSSLTNRKYKESANGGLSERFKLDALLDNVMLYHLTNSIITSSRLFAETHSQQQRELQMDWVPTDVPTGCARFKHDLIHFYDNQLKDKYRNLIHSKYYSNGGHFVALEMPQLLYADFIEFVKKVEKFSSSLAWF
ncbi:PREDICTED: juvenile hormone epoxide hydrolase 2 [Rhagoletis zephyria]|uniref:juvenile hormone epoxide hydrolase 2 n=1 Tax=Rhagoletis zephyria TaxID=28612 RepID=UPI00081175DC|nr:PREDICTED: juvenile hormone epoxide hydrolase 2 [Rhagoletis zephyria]